MNFNSGVPRFESKKKKKKKIDRSNSDYCSKTTIVIDIGLANSLSNMCTNHNAKQFCSDVFITVYHHQCNLYSRYVKQLGKSDP